MTDAAKAADQAARRSYGRLLAILARGTRDLAAAEDALSAAFASALVTWPSRGIPDNPEGWLLRAARNRIANERRGRGVRDGAVDELLRRYDGLAEEGETFPDERLKLLFVCGHPAIDAGVRAPLMMQTVLGLDAARIAGVFLTTPATMSQRLVRAKAKIRHAGLRFAEPEREDLADRLADVLDAVYAAYGVGWDAIAGAVDGAARYATEAIDLARVIVDLLPGEPEPRGLLALMLYCEARRPARRGADGGFVPLHRQDARLWSREAIVEAENLLIAASRFGRFGRYQCEAAIQSVHVQRPITGRLDVDALRRLYDLLQSQVPSIGVRVARAAMLVEAGDLDAADEALGVLAEDRVAAYQPYWVVRARLATKAGNLEKAAAAHERAIALTQDPAVRAWIERERNGG